MRTVTTLRPDIDVICDLVLRTLLPHRRAEIPHDPATESHRSCFSAQLDAIADFVRADEPIHLTLPAFPCKSPNQRKVLGHLPDLGELLSLRFLDHLCRQIAQIHEPGARVLICSDGHVFSDLIRVPDNHVDEYSDALQVMIDQDGLEFIDTYSLRDAFPEMTYDDRRQRLTDEFAQSIDSLREEVRADDTTLRLYRGITRFLVEDTDGTSDLSRAAQQRECRQRAYGVIQRSRAWGELLAHDFPRSVRLSIHPQPCGSAKFGINLLEITDSWLTPWHSSAVLRADGRFALMKRVEAEQIGHLVERDGRPSHYVVLSSN